MDQFFAAIRLASFLGTSGAFFALGFAGVCRWLKWSPVNINVTINNPPGQFSTVNESEPDAAG
jgi:hypothetical protein